MKTEISFPKCARIKCDFGKYRVILWRYVPKCGKNLCDFGKNQALFSIFKIRKYEKKRISCFSLF